MRKIPFQGILTAYQVEKVIGKKWASRLFDEVTTDADHIRIGLFHIRATHALEEAVQSSCKHCFTYGEKIQIHEEAPEAELLHCEVCERTWYRPDPDSYEWIEITSSEDFEAVSSAHKVIHF